MQDFYNLYNGNMESSKEPHRWVSLSKLLSDDKKRTAQDGRTWKDWYMGFKKFFGESEGNGYDGWLEEDVKYTDEEFLSEEEEDDLRKLGDLEKKLPEDDVLKKYGLFKDFASGLMFMQYFFMKEKEALYDETDVTKPQPNKVTFQYLGGGRFEIKAAFGDQEYMYRARLKLSKKEGLYDKLKGSCLEFLPRLMERFPVFRSFLDSKDEFKLVYEELVCPEINGNATYTRKHEGRGKGDYIKSLNNDLIMKRSKGIFRSKYSLVKGPDKISRKHLARGFESFDLTLGHFARAILNVEEVIPKVERKLKVESYVNSTENKPDIDQSGNDDGVFNL